MRIFVSYHSPDQALAETLIADLTAARATLDFYFAPRDNAGGAYWLPRLETELDAADALLLVVGDQIGEWQELEYFEALRLNRARGRPLIVPVIAAKDAPGLPFLDQFHQLDFAGGRTEAIEAALRALDGAAAGPGGAREAPAWRTTNPYRGLRPFESQNAAFFFGRDALTSRMIEALAADEAKVLTLIGASGVGKSSLISAGLFSALRSRFHPNDQERPWPAALAESHRWRTLTIRPGERPLMSLALGFARIGAADASAIEADAARAARDLAGGAPLAALADAAAARLQGDGGAPARFLLNVDQGEELYSRAAPDEADRAAKAIVDAATSGAMTVVMSLRADFYGRFQGDAALFPAARRIDAPPLGPAEMAEVIAKPAARLGARFEAPGLVDEIAAAAAAQPGGLPLLSVMMEETWEAMRREPVGDGVLRLPAGAVDLSLPLASRAEGFLAAHPSLESAAQRLFTLRLAHMPKLGPPMRRRARRSECGEDEWAAARALAAPEWRLLTLGEDAGDPTAEVAHEALFAAWPRLAEWLDEEREFLIWRGRLQDARREWEAAPEARRDDAALMGLSLAAARDWLDRRDWALPASDRAFIRISADLEAARRREAAAQEAALTAEKERSRRRAAWLGRVAGVAAAAFLALSGWAVWERGRAEDERDRAEIARSEAEDEAERAESEAARAEAEATRAAAERDLALSRGLSRTAEALLNDRPGQTAAAAMVAADALTLRPTPEALSTLRAALALAPTSPAPADDWGADSVVFSPDGARAAWIRRDSSGLAEDKDIVRTELVALAPDDLSVIWRGAIEGGAAARLIPGGETVVASGAAREVLIAKIGGDERRIPTRGDATALIAPDGETIHVVRESGRIDVLAAPDWSREGALSFPAIGGAGTIDAVRAGDALLIGEFAFPMGAIINAPLSGAPPSKIPFRTDPIANVHDQGRPLGIAAGGGVAVSRHDDGAIRVWRTDGGGAPEERRIENTRHVNAIAVDQTTGTVAATGSRYVGEEARDYVGVVALWDADGAIKEGWVHDGLAFHVAFSPGGEMLAVGGYAGFSARTVDGGKVIRGLEGEVVSALAFAPDGTLLIGAKSGRLARFDLDAGAVASEARLKGPVHDLFVDPLSGRVAASIGVPKTTGNWTDIRIKDVESGAEVFSASVNGWLRNFAFSPDGEAFAAEDEARGETVVWRVRSGRVALRAPIEGVLRGFDQTGDRLIFGDFGLALHSAETGERLAKLGEKSGVDQLFHPGPTDFAVVRGEGGGYGGFNLATGVEVFRTDPGAPASTRWRSRDGRHGLLHHEGDGAAEIVEAATGRVKARFPAPFIDQAALNDGLERTFYAAPLNPDEYGRSERYRLTLAAIPSGEAIWSEELDSVTIPPRFHTLAGGGFVADVTGDLGGGFGRRLLIVHHEGVAPWTPSEDAGDRYTFGPAAPDGETILLFNHAAGQWELRDARDGAVRWRRDGVGPSSGGGRRSAAFLPTSGRIALVETVRHDPDETDIRIVDAATGRETAARRFDGLHTAIGSSTDGAQLFLGAKDDAAAALVAFDADTLEERVRLPATDAVDEIKGLSDVDRVALLDSASVLEVWDLEAAIPLHRIAMTVTATQFETAERAPRAVTMRGASLRLWDTGLAEQIAATVGEGEVAKPRISPDGRMVAYASSSGAGSHVGLWRPDRSGETIRIPAENVRDIGFSPDGGGLFILTAELARGDNAWRAVALRLIDTETLATRFALRAAPAGEIRRVGFTGDGRSLFLEEGGTYQGRGLTLRRKALRVFDAETGRERARRAMIGSAAVRPNGSNLIYRAEDTRLKRLDLAAAEWDLALAPSGRLRTAPRSTRALNQSFYGDNAVFDAAVDGPGATVLQPDIGPHVVLFADLSPDGEVAAFALRDREGDDGRGSLIVVRDATTGEALAQLKADRRYWALRFAGADHIVLSELHQNYVDETAYHTVLWNWRRGALKTLVDDNPVVDLVADRDGSRFATVEGTLDGIEDRKVVGDRQIRIWDVASGEALHRIPTTYAFPKLSFSPDGRRIAIMETAKGVLYDLEAGAPVLTFGADEERREGVPHAPSPIIPNKVNRLWPGFSSDGGTLYIVTETEIVRRDLNSGETTRFAERAPIKNAVFSRDGRFLALETDGAALVWDLEVGERVAALPVAGLTDLAFAGPDAKRLLASGEGGVRRLIWNAGDLISRACAAFAVDDWPRGRFLATGATDAGPCGEQAD